MNSEVQLENDKAIEILAEQYPDITENEIALYRVARVLPPLPPEKSAQLYELFLIGKTCREIAALNTDISLGLIVRARIEDQWDRQKFEYMMGLQAMTHDKVTKMQLEVMGHIALNFAVHHKLNEPAMLKYMQTGNKEDLAGVFPIPYKQLIEFISKLNEKPPNVNVTINEKGKQDKTVTVQRESPADALKRLAKKVKNESGNEEE